MIWFPHKNTFLREKDGNEEKMCAWEMDGGERFIHILSRTIVIYYNGLRMLD